MTDPKFLTGFNSDTEASEALPTATVHWIIPYLEKMGGEDISPLLRSTICSIATNMERGTKLSRADIIAEIGLHGCEEFSERYRSGIYDISASTSKWIKGTRKDDWKPASKSGLLDSIKEIAKSVAEGLPIPSRKRSDEKDFPDFSMTIDEKKLNEKE